VYYATDIKPATEREAVDNFKKKHNLFSKKIILFGGRLSPAKGGEVAVRSLAHIVEQVPEAVLLVAGIRNDYSKYLEQIAEELGVGKSMIFTGWLNREEMNLAYASCDVVITPSIYLDAFNLFNLEAMAAGKPVVGTCFGGTPEVIQNGVTGYVVNPFNIEMTDEKIIDLLKNPDIAKAFGEAGIKRTREYFNTEIYISSMLSWYEKFVPAR
jgi:glycosyltransferase involved in cell wall biosynthesis